MSLPDYDGAIAFALARLEQQLPPELTYHNVWHTRSDVMPACARLADACDVDAAEARLLQVAAAFHDIGYTEVTVTHEIVGARIVAQELPRFGFSARAIERVMGMIIATRVPQSPTNLLEQIIADTDLDVLGRHDFMARNAALRGELASLGSTSSDEAWLAGQLAFLRGHSYFTDAARALRRSAKAAHAATLEVMLHRLRDAGAADE